MTLKLTDRVSVADIVPLIPAHHREEYQRALVESLGDDWSAVVADAIMEIDPLQNQDQLEDMVRDDHRSNILFEVAGYLEDAVEGTTSPEDLQFASIAAETDPARRGREARWALRNLRLERSEILTQMRRFQTLLGGGAK